MSKRQLPPDRVSSYFRAESGVLAVITVTGLLYNIGLVAGPWFEGQMTEALARILLGGGSFSTMVSLAAGYIAVVAAVQGLRFLKRFYVRRFANKVNRPMKRVLYGALVRSDRGDSEREGAGTVLTKAISDVDDCAEGMRKFTTEVFDTGVALAAYAGSAIAKADPMKTGFNATKLAIAAFIVPYIFAFSPQMLFVDVTGAFQVVQICISALLGIFGVAAALNGFLYRPIPALLRVAMAVGGLGMMIPGTATDIAGFVLVVGIVLYQRFSARRTAMV